MFHSPITVKVNDNILSLLQVVTLICLYVYLHTNKCLNWYQTTFTFTNYQAYMWMFYLKTSVCIYVTLLKLSQIIKLIWICFTHQVLSEPVLHFPFFTNHEMFYYVNVYPPNTVWIYDTALTIILLLLWWDLHKHFFNSYKTANTRRLTFMWLNWSNLMCYEPQSYYKNV